MSFESKEMFGGYTLDELDELAEKAEPDELSMIAALSVPELTDRLRSMDKELASVKKAAQQILDCARQGSIDEDEIENLEAKLRKEIVIGEQKGEIQLYRKKRR